MSVRPRPDWVTLPNAVTLVRLALVVPICLLIARDSVPGLTLALVVLFGMSDWVDGYLARRLDQISRAGVLLDPVVDRAGVAAIAVALVMAGHVPLAVAFVIAGVDLVLLVALAIVRPPSVPDVSRMGKLRTAVLMSGLALVTVGLLPGLPGVATVGVWLSAAGAALHAVAGIGYLRALLHAGRRRS